MKKEFQDVLDYKHQHSYFKYATLHKRHYLLSRLNYVENVSLLDYAKRAKTFIIVRPAGGTYGNGP